MSIPTLPEITAQTITTKRLTTRVLFSGPEDGIPVLFLHGNTSSATWWEETMVALPAGFRGIAPDQRGYGDADPEAKIDATKGMQDLSYDAFTLMDALDIQKFHVVGNSLGGMVVWHMLTFQPWRILTATQVSPGSPFGYGATKDIAGNPTNNDFAGSGGGLSNPELIKRLAETDMTTDSPFSPRAALRTIIVKPGLILDREDELVLSMCATHLGEQDIPGDSTQSAHWPHVAPGVWGGTNATSPKYNLEIAAKLTATDPKPPILWVRGSHDLLVSDTAASDPGFLGQAGLMPGWPGAEVFPPQPMLGQTRAALEAYAKNGGSYEEVVIPDAGHVPYLEKPAEFNAVFHQRIQS